MSLLPILSIEKPADSSVRLPERDPRSEKIARQMHEIQSWYPKVEIQEDSATALHGRFQALHPRYKEEVRAECIGEYQKAIEEYEIEAAALCFEDERSKEFAAEMCRRIRAVINAYIEVTQPNLTPFKKELRSLLILTEILGNRPEATGSVGFNPLSIKKVFEEGNIREKMALTYAFNKGPDGFFLINILKNNDPKMLEKINARLEANEEGFQLDIDFIDKDNARKTGIPNSNRVNGFRTMTGGEKGRPDRVLKERTKMGCKIQNIADISLREVRAGLGDYDITKEEFEAMKQGNNRELETRMLKWKSGMDWCTVNPRTDFAKETVHLGLPSTSIVCGPSGTTDALVLRASRYLGMEDLEGATKAAIAWMVPVQHHSLHEILQASSDSGLPYKGLPKDFDQGFGIHGFATKMKERLQKKGLEMPSHYLGIRHQLVTQNSVSSFAAEDSATRHENIAAGIEADVQRLERTSEALEEL